MKLFLCITLFALLGRGAYAEDKKPECGKTVEECQKMTDMLQKQLQVYKGLLTEANDRLVAQAAR